MQSAELLNQQQGEAKNQLLLDQQVMSQQCQIMAQRSNYTMPATLDVTQLLYLICQYSWKFFFLHSRQQTIKYYYDELPLRVFNKLLLQSYLKLIDHQAASWRVAFGFHQEFDCFELTFSHSIYVRDRLCLCHTSTQTRDLL